MPSRRDVDLIRRAVEGDERAFDQLVLRYRGIVLRIARDVVPSREFAEDAAQEALLEAHRSLRWLRDPERFEGWLATITRRVAARVSRRRSGRTEEVEWLSGPVRAVIREEPGPAQTAVADRIREAIEELSARQRTVMVMHYLQGRELEEVAHELGLPVGTVKRTLFEARREIREEVGLVAASQESRARKLTHWIHGMYDGRNPRNVFALMAPTLAQSICLAVNKRARTLKGIAKAVGADEGYVAETVGLLVGEEILVQEGDSYRAGFPALDAEDWQAVTADVRRLARQAAEALGPHLPRLQAAYAKAPLSRAWPWEDVAWPVVGIMTVNLATQRALAEEAVPEAPFRPSGGKYWLAGYEPTEGKEPLWTTGFVHCPPDNAQELGHGLLWTHGLRREGVSVGNAMAQFLGALHRGCRSARSAAPHVEGGLEAAQELAARWLEQGLLLRDKRGLRIGFPVFRAADDEALIEAVDAAAEEVTEHVLRGLAAGVIAELKRRGYGHLGERLSVFPTHLRYDINGETLRRLVSDKALPPPPSHAPAKWAFFGWEYGLELLKWRR